MDEMMHLAAQYLAAAGISFLDPKDDDSHTNIGFSVEESTAYTHLLTPEGDTLGLNFEEFSLVWDNYQQTSILPLHGQSHPLILEWIEHQAKMSGIEKPYKYKFHYELPYSVDEHKIFELKDVDRLQELKELRVVAQNALEEFLEDQRMHSNVRIWPHHFDTGGFAQLPGLRGVSVGMGLAIPDSVCPEHYYYLGAYRGQDPIETGIFQPLKQGRWVQEGFMGAIMPAKGKLENEVQNFLLSAMHSYLSPYG